MFHNADEYRELYPDEDTVPAIYCAPVIDEGDVLERIRDRIDGRIPREPKPRAGQLRGHIDAVGYDFIEGWAFDEGRPDDPVMVRIVDNGVTIGEVRANRPRPDVRRAGYGNGLCGFRLQITDGLSPWTQHVIEIFRSCDDTSLPTSPLVFGETLRAKRAAA
jgi:hypothetical protein